MDRAIHNLQHSNLLAAQICVESHKSHEKRHDAVLQTTFIMMAQILFNYNKIMEDMAVKKGENIDGTNTHANDFIRNSVDSGGDPAIQIAETTETSPTTGSDDVQSIAENKTEPGVRNTRRRHTSK